MKAFVLKNNEGLYYTTHLYYEDIHTENISEASIYNKKIANDMKLFLNKSTYGEKWKVVEITIEENEQLDAYIDKLQDERDFERRDKTYIVKQLNDPNDYVIREDYIKLEQENKQLEEQHDLLIDEFQKEREKLCKQIKQESDARERFVKKVKQLKEQLDKKDKEIRELKSIVYIVKRPQGNYEDYREEIEKVFLDKEKAEKYIQEENKKLPLDQANRCRSCTWHYQVGSAKQGKKPDCLTSYFFGTCDNYLKYKDVEPLFIEEYKIEDKKEEE